jgi:uncharacterized repeat protein (TIGR04138 family)
MAAGDDAVEPEKSLKEVVEALGVYPVEAFNFVQQGLGYTVQKIHGQRQEKESKDPKEPKASRHVSGQQLCEGLKEYALLQWGMMAEAVLRRWNITTTFDFGRIVFTLVENGFMQQTEEDTVEDFRNVYDFKTAFAAGYKIESKP